MLKKNQLSLSLTKRLHDLSLDHSSSPDSIYYAAKVNYRDCLGPSGVDCKKWAKLVSEHFNSSDYKIFLPLLEELESESQAKINKEKIADLLKSSHWDLED